MTDFTLDDIANPLFEKDIQDTYSAMAWAIADQVNSTMLSTMEAQAASATTSFDAIITVFGQEPETPLQI